MRTSFKGFQQPKERNNVNHSQDTKNKQLYLLRNFDGSYVCSLQQPSGQQKNDLVPIKKLYGRMEDTIQYHYLPQKQRRVNLESVNTSNTQNSYPRRSTHPITNSSYSTVSHTPKGTAEYKERTPLSWDCWNMQDSSRIQALWDQPTIMLKPWY
eukprot:TRINITY_DN4959_c0_g1_i1.p1 TRINITY_DN4959_c0_g1~~TRINITY_DN4959_c0_g1_i1.p1  ORF type:complete len:154 (+),score=11.81 TRINITY_DN4959_c0_g1_i1:214-675(+)